MQLHPEFAALAISCLCWLPVAEGFAQPPVLEASARGHRGSSAFGPSPGHVVASIDVHVPFKKRQQASGMPQAAACLLAGALQGCILSILATSRREGRVRVKAFRKPQMDDEEVDPWPYFHWRIVGIEFVKIPTDGLFSYFTTIHHVGVIVEFESGGRFLIDRMDKPNKVRLLRDSSQNREAWTSMSRHTAKPGTTLCDCWEAACEGGGYNLFFNNCVHTRDRILRRVGEDDELSAWLYVAAAGALGAVRSIFGDINAQRDVSLKNAGIDAAGSTGGVLACFAMQRTTGSQPISRGAGAGVTSLMREGARGARPDQLARSAAAATLKEGFRSHGSDGDTLEEGVRAGTSIIARGATREVLKAATKCATKASVGTDLLFDAPAIADDISKDKPVKAGMRTFVCVHQALWSAGCASIGGPVGMAMLVGASAVYGVFHKAVNEMDE